MMTEDRMNRNLDAALAAWARDDLGDDATIARLLAHADTLAATAPAAKPVRRWLPWAAGGGALAASLAVALLLAAPGNTPATEPAVAVAATPATTSTGEQSFALLYSPTLEEEQYL